jgi:FkbM family methyltransferase
MPPVRKYGYYALSAVEVAARLTPGPAALLSLAGPMLVDEVGVRGSDVRLRVRSPMDVWTVKETWVDRVYERFGAPLRDGWTVFDVGAGFGDFSLRAAAAGPDVRVHAFEPHPGSRALLADNVARNHAANVTVHAEAVGAQTGRVDLLAAEQALDSAVTAAADGGVPALSLADAMAAVGAQRVDLLKLDCEGSEFPILQGAGAGTLARVQRIVMEYHDDLPAGRDHRALGALLASHGYAVRAWPSPVHRHLGYLRAVRG